MSDDRDFATHFVHGIGHLINYGLKNVGISGIEESNRAPWDKKVDYDRAGYHLMKFSEQMEHLMDYGPP